jgi:hypothetical protein
VRVSLSMRPSRLLTSWRLRYPSTQAPPIMGGGVEEAKLKNEKGGERIGRETDQCLELVHSVVTDVHDACDIHDVGGTEILCT